MAREMAYTGLPQLIPRHVFARDHFDYVAGEHAVFGGPTRKGKTQLAFDLLQYAATPTCPVYVAVSKPRDPVTSYYARKYHWRIVRDWPPTPRVRDYFQRSKTTGYVVWPRFGDMHTDAENAGRITGDLLDDRYTAGARQGKEKVAGILMIDDTMTKSEIMGLDREMVIILAMAGAMDLGEWTFVQKATDSGRTVNWSYSQATHVFLFRDPDRRSVERYRQIGDVDPEYIESVLVRLEDRQALYICRKGPYFAIVEGDSMHGKIGST